MHKIQEVLEQLPSQSFRDAFKSGVSDLKKRASTDEHTQSIQQIEEGHELTCEFFDQTIEVLRSTMANHSAFELNDLEYSEIENLMSEYKQLIDKVENVDIGSPDFNGARQNFISTVSGITSTYVGNKEKQASFRRLVMNMIQSIRLKPLIAGSNLDEVQKAFDTAKKLNKKLSTIESAHEAAQSLLDKREPLIQDDIKQRISDLKGQADDHTGGQVWGWFVAGCVLGVIAFITLFGLIYGIRFGETEIVPAADKATFGEALLRFGLVSVILYFAFYCIKQFSIHRHLHQLYGFKEVSLRVMLDLRGEMDELEKKLVLAKGLEAIFSEPSTGLVHQKEAHGDYWQSVQRILERVVSKNADPQ